MINHTRVAQKRLYTAPKLVAYGDMATLTRGGSGSIRENGHKLTPRV